MTILYAFLVGGAICCLAQIVADKFKLMPIHITCGLVFIGALLDVFDIYDKLIDFAGAGAMIPISSFGHSLVHSALLASETEGFIGILTGVFSLTSGGISAAIIFAFFASLIFKPKG